MEWKQADPQLVKLLAGVCETNPWICEGGFCFENNPLLDTENDFQFLVAQTPEELEAFFTRGNWPIRQGILYNALAFVNQSHGGDDWWCLKLFSDCCIGFDVISFLPVIELGEFRDFLAKMEAATKIQCITHTYDDEPSDEEIEAMEALLEEPPTPRIVETRAVHLESHNALFAFFKANSLNRFLNHDWGEICEDDRLSNDQTPDYKLAGYNFPPGVQVEGESKLWIIYDGNAITILFPSDY